jgi:hypothetical protein
MLRLLERLLEKNELLNDLMCFKSFQRRRGNIDKNDKASAGPQKVDYINVIPKETIQQVTSKRSLWFQHQYFLFRIFNK